MTTIFDAVNPIFRGISGGLGAAYQISKKYLVKLNIAKGYRPPNIAELSSNGVHEGTFKYEIGNANLKPESSWEIDAAAAMHRSHVSIELDLFNNRINQFIFARQLNSAIGQDSMRDGFNVFQFQATPVNLNGGELQIDIHPHPWDWLHFENAISYVNARQLKATADSTKYLPNIPAAKINTTVRIDFAKTGNYLKNTYVKIELENVFAQNNVYIAYHTETKTPGYQLINLGMGGSICNAKKQEIATVILAITNCTNQVYQSHLSRLKYASMNEATNQRGVFNMGRNFSIKLVIPFNTKLK
jgi:iron complex outermembrane receptor protein